MCETYLLMRICQWVFCGIWGWEGREEGEGGGKEAPSALIYLEDSCRRRPARTAVPFL